MSTDRRSAAEAWARRGFKVFRVLAGRKEPLTTQWIDEATSDADAVRALWSDPVMGWPLDHNIGVLTDDLIVVDIDDKKGKTGTASYVDLDLPWDTLLVKTPSGGRHAYFDGPSRSLSVGKLGPGLDIRSFHGYVLAPGSTLAGHNGDAAGDYTLDHDAPVLRVPAALLDRLDAPVERQSQQALVELDSASSLVRATDFLRDEAQLSIEGAGGDMTAFKVACTLKDLGITEETAFGLLTEFWNDRCSPPWDWDELRIKVENAYGYGKVAPGAHTAEAALAGVVPMKVDRVPASWLKHGDAYGEANWLFYETLPATGAALLVGPSHAGKTFLFLELARCLATGKPFFGLEPDDRGGTAVLAGEGGSGLNRRLAALGEAVALPIVARDPGLLAGNLPALVDDLKDLSAAMMQDHGVPLRLIVIDTMSSCGLVEDENDNVAVATAMKALGKLSEMTGALVLATHHPSKSGAEERGAGAWRASADAIWHIAHESPAEKVRELEITKLREAALKKLGAFTITPVVLGTDSRGRDITSACVAAAPPITPKERETQFGQLLVECVEWCIAEGPERIDGRDCAELEAVKEMFTERKTGSRDRGNIARAYRAALDFALGAGAVEQIAWQGRTYLALRTF